MLHEAILDLGRTDAITAARNQVVLSPLVPEVPVAVLDRDIAGQAPTAGEFCTSRLQIDPIAKKHHRNGALHPDDPAFSGREWSAIRRHDLDTVAGGCPTHRSRAHRKQQRAVANEQIGLGLPVELVDLDPEGLAAPAEDVLAERFAAARDRAEAV